MCARRSDQNQYQTTQSFSQPIPALRALPFLLLPSPGECRTSCMPRTPQGFYHYENTEDIGDFKAAEGSALLLHSNHAGVQLVVSLRTRDDTAKTAKRKTEGPSTIRSTVPHFLSPFLPCFTNAD